VYSTQNK